MRYREDYYKFTHYLLPNAVFGHGRLHVYRLMRDEKQFIEHLKKAWSAIEMEKPQHRSDPPDFKLDIINFSVEHTGFTLTIPEAGVEQEAVYIGITYDRDDNFRYFTYEIGKDSKGDTVYLLCECTEAGEHLIYRSYSARDKNIFEKEISELLVYDLL